MQNHAVKPGMISFNLKRIKIAKCFFFSQIHLPFPWQK